MEALWSAGPAGVSGDKQHQLPNVELLAGPQGEQTPAPPTLVPPKRQARGQNKTCPVLGQRVWEFAGQSGELGPARLSERLCCLI